MQKPQTLKGFRDFLPEEKRQRDFVASKLKQTFETFGFAPLETPTLEYASLLLGKYGEEADKLVYTFDDKGDRRVGLRYDQTVPTARVLSQYNNELPRFFRRYQMQNVFRADKPQKGRYREFAQCDIDIFGSTSTIADAEILAVTYAGLKAVGFTNITIQMNDRNLLMQSLSEFVTPEVSIFSIIQTLDKLDKQSETEVIAELTAKGIQTETASRILSKVNNVEKSSLLSLIEQYCLDLGIPSESLVYNPYLARGLDYYTGLIYEFSIPEYSVGSVAGGGRYDNLINELTGQPMPAVGLGMGFDRIVEAALELNLIPNAINATQVLITVFAEQTTQASFAVATELRNAGIKTELYPAVDNLGKQFKLADQKQIPWVVIIGDDEVSANTVTLKNMSTGEQQTLSVAEVLSYIRSQTT